MKIKNKELPKPKIAVIDIETYPAKVLIYGNIYEPVVVKIIEFQQILSMSIRLYGEKKTKYIGQNNIKGYKPGVINDKNLLLKIIDQLKDVDYICGHNSDNFDINIIKERIMFHRLAPLPDIPTLDTKKLMKTASKLPSNKLQHVTQFLGNGGKLEHNGTDLFIACGNGDKKAWKINEIYNKRDVDITYADLEDMIPYVKLTSKQTVFSGNLTCSNPLCLSHKLKPSKLRKVVGGYRRQFQCDDCGRYTTDKQLIKE